MVEYMTLLGAESIKNAGCNMRHAAEEMTRAAGHIDESIRNGLIRLENLVIRLEALQKGDPNDNTDELPVDSPPTQQP